MQRKKMDIIYLDTTYCDPKYQFPAQEQVISACADLIRSFVADGDHDALKRGFKDGAQTLKSEKMIKSWLGAASVKAEVKEERQVVCDSHEAEVVENQAAASLAQDRYHDAPDDKSEEYEELGDHGLDEDEDDAPARQATFLADQPEPSEEGNKDEGALEVEDDKKCKKDRILVLVGTYSIGKERLVKGEPSERHRVCLLYDECGSSAAIAKALGSKIYGSEHKLELMRCIDEDAELRSMLTTDPLDAAVHVSRLDSINRDNMTDYLDSFKGHFTKVASLIGVAPVLPFADEQSKMLDWVETDRLVVQERFSSHEKPGRGTGDREPDPQTLFPSMVVSTEGLYRAGARLRCAVQRAQCAWLSFFVSLCRLKHRQMANAAALVQSFRELTCFCTSVSHVRIIPTVNVHTESSRAKMRAWFERWQAERKRRSDVGEPAMVCFCLYFGLLSEG